MLFSDYFFESDLIPRKSVYVRLTNRATGEQAMARTREDGSFTVELSPGMYRVERSLPGGPWREIGIDLDIALKAGQTDE